MTRRRERKRPPIVDKFDEYKSYGINFTLESKDAFIEYIKTWLGFECTSELIMYKHYRVLTLYRFTSEERHQSFNMVIIRNGGYQFFYQYLKECKSVEDVWKRLHSVFKQLLPEYYDKLKFSLWDFANYFVIRNDSEIPKDQCNCILFRIEYFTHKNLWDYLTNVAYTRTDETVRKYQISN